MSSAQRLLDTMALFTPRHPSWTPMRAAKVLGISRASAYRYFAMLAEVALLEPAPGLGYSLGPAIVELDRQIRLSDPLLQTSIDEMLQLAREASATVLLCRLYRDRVLCVHQERGARASSTFVSYERGRAMPLYRGATSKAILAFLPTRALNRLVERDRDEIVRARLPAEGAALRRALGLVREKRIAVTAGEVGPGACGAAVPLFEAGRVIGSLSVVMPASALRNNALERACRALVAAGSRIEAELERNLQRPARRSGEA